MSSSENQSSPAAQPLPDIRRTVTLNAPIEKAWAAVSTAEGMAAWFMPSNMQAVVGNEFLLEAGPFGQSPCKVTEVKEPNRLSFRWAKDWLVTFELHELEGGKTELTLTHSGWSAEQVTEFGQPHSVVRDRMDGGWIGILDKLAKLLEA